MTENVVGLRDKLFQAPGAPNERVIAHLENWLAAARRGEVDGIAVAASRPNGKVSFNYYLGPEVATFRVIAAVALMEGDLKSVMCDAMSEGDVDDPAR